MKKQGFEIPVFSLVRRDAFTLRCVVLNNSQSPLKIHLLFHTALLHLTEKPQKSPNNLYCFWVGKPDFQATTTTPSCIVLR